MFNTKFVVYKKRSMRSLLNDRGGASGKTVSEIAYILWEKHGKPEGQSEYFWKEAENIVNPPKTKEVVTEWVCGDCGRDCYYDGRCGDGPIKYCGCWGNSVPKSEYKPKDRWW